MINILSNFILKNHINVPIILVIPEFNGKTLELFEIGPESLEDSNPGWLRLAGFSVLCCFDTPLRK